MTAALQSVDDPAGTRVLRLSGRLDASTVHRVWRPARALVDGWPDRPILVDCAAVSYCDGTGIGLLVDLLRRPRPTGAEVRVEQLAPEYDALLAQFDPADYRARAAPAPRRVRPVEWLGRTGARLAQDSHAQVSFLGDAGAALAAMVRWPRMVRWRDVLAIAEEAGVNAMPIVGLIAFLLGVILTFQSATAMRPYGAEVYVADLVGLSLLRELGPLMTAILLAGRSAAAFAAELGTMKVGDEISALETMGLDPVRFLVAPRLAAAVLVTPLLTVYADLVGLSGSALTMLLFDVPLVTFVQQVTGIVQPRDFLGGLIKSVAFGAAIAGIGCLRGMQAGNDAAAVGQSTTRAVVSALVLIVCIDGVFAVLYYQLGI